MPHISLIPRHEYSQPELASISPPPEKCRFYGAQPYQWSKKKKAASGRFLRVTNAWPSPTSPEAGRFRTRAFIRRYVKGVNEFCLLVSGIPLTRINTGIEVAVVTPSPRAPTPSPPSYPPRYRPRTSPSGRGGSAPAPARCRAPPARRAVPAPSGGRSA